MSKLISVVKRTSIENKIFASIGIAVIVITIINIALFGIPTN